VRDGICLFYMYTGGDLIMKAWLLPFVTDACGSA
jgi:hypothetical protein